VASRAGEVFDASFSAITSSHSFASGDDVLTDLRGAPPLGERGEDRTARVLVGKLNEAGGAWSLPRKVHRDRLEDCVARDASGSELRIQVVVSRVDPGAWSALAREGASSARERRRDVVDALKRAVELKAEHVRRPLREGLVLALNGSCCTAGSFVGDLYRAIYGRWTAELGFHSVWFVGVSARVTWRMDVQGRSV